MAWILFAITFYLDYLLTINFKLIAIPVSIYILNVLED
nr:MAG TPA: hypothetical protein [Herelleviridae sp.]